MTWFLRFLLWLSVGTIAFAGAIAVYLFVALRRIELFPAIAGAAVIPAALLLMIIRYISSPRARSGPTEPIETIIIADVPLEVVEIA
jgi:hypothetical protein